MDKGGKILLGLTALFVTGYFINQSMNKNKKIAKQQKDNEAKTYAETKRLQKELEQYKNPQLVRLPDAEDPGIKKFIVKG